MGLFAKDIGLFQEVADRAEVPLELYPLLTSIFKDGIQKFGPRELSPNIIRRMEDVTGLSVLAPGFSTEITDEEAKKTGYEIKVG